MKWEKAWAYLTCSNVLVVSVRLQLSCSAPVLGGATVRQHSTDQLPFWAHSCLGWGESCPLLQFSNLVLTINRPHFLWGSPWFWFGSTLFFFTL